MQKRTREIIALVLLIVLGVAVLCAMGWYILVGHNWNVAASNIDDSLGQMKGYTVFLVKGNKPIPEVKTATDETGADGVSTEDSAPLVENETADEEATSAITTIPSQIASVAEERIPRTLHELIIEYQDKGADVFVIENIDGGAYLTPVTLRTSTQSIGVFKVGSPARPAAVKVGAKLMNRMSTDFNILVTSDTNFEKTVVRDVDVIVFDQPGVPYTDGHYAGNSYCVNTPYIGQIEAIIISPSGVISSKVIDL